ncbi:MAG TPA: DUF721 domain-containing protein [Kofleriaceae bacterium]|nr:DUF721 domain-containing protein [Kofleriaceae bacterium]
MIQRRRPPRADGVRSAKDAVGAALAFHGIADAVRAERVLTEWSELVGPRIASRTRPLCVDGRVLVIEVATSAWLHELNLLKPQILAGLLERVGQPRPFEELAFRLAGRSRSVPRRPAPRAASFGPRRETPIAPATGAAREQIVRDVEKIDDAELRELVARVRIANDR